MTVKETGILMKPDLIDATLEGRKVRTSRILRNPFAYVVHDSLRIIRKDEVISVPDNQAPMGFDITEKGAAQAPYGRAGDRLYIKEAWRTSASIDHLAPSKIDFDFWPVYWSRDGDQPTGAGRQRSPLHMPKRVARVWMEIEDVQIFPIQELTVEGVYEEGFPGMRP